MRGERGGQMERDEERTHRKWQPVRVAVQLPFFFGFLPLSSTVNVVPMMFALQIHEYVSKIRIHIDSSNRK